MTGKQNKDEKKKKTLTVYAHVRGLYERAYHLNQKRGKPGSCGAVKTIRVERNRKAPGDLASITVHYIDGYWGQVLNMRRADAERWAKRVGKRMGATVFLPAWSKSASLSV